MKFDPNSNPPSYVSVDAENVYIYIYIYFFFKFF